LRVLFVTSEIYPLVKTGGLADVCGALPPALAEQGIDVRCVVPGYPSVLGRLLEARAVTDLHDLFGGAGTLVEGRLENGTTVLAIDAPHLFDRPGNPYLGPGRLDWPDNDLRFAALGWVGAHLARGDFEGWPADILHAHDWQAGLAPAYLALQGGRRPATVMTIHNMAYQGLFPAERLELLRLPPESLAVEGVEYYGKVGFLKGGLYYADRITAVSPTYAREIQGPEQGVGLQGLLHTRRADLVGILNGVDEAVWDPASDPHLASRYDASDMAGKAVNKVALQERYGLAPQPARPLLGVVSRLTPQKGLDLLLAGVPGLLASGAQLAVLGSGDADLEEGFRRAAADHPRQAGVVIGYDEPLSHLIQGGADAIIVPSRAEPCGLTQLYGLRYGTLPVVAKVGGLADSVIDANEAALNDGVATGFVFAPVTAEALTETLKRAIDLYGERDRWRMVQRRAMSREVGWHASAARYAALYRDLVTSRRARAAAR
jgi:starch synthase